MQPVKAAHSILAVQQAAAPTIDVDAPELAVTVPAAAAAVDQCTPLRRGTPVAMLGDDCLVSPIEEFDPSHAGGWPSSRATPKNSNRMDSNGCAVMMLPRSSRSIRHSVLQARLSAPSLVASAATCASSLAPKTPGTPSSVGRRRAAPVPLGTDVAHAAGAWLATPTNGDRRDVRGSVQVMAPLWRGSGTITPSQISSRPGTSGATSATVFSQPGIPYVMPTPSSATPSSMSMRRGAPKLHIGADAGQPVSSWMTTPKNGDRRDMNGSVQMMTPLWRGSAATPSGTQAAHNVIVDHAAFSSTGHLNSQLASRTCAGYPSSAGGGYPSVCNGAPPGAAGELPAHSVLVPAHGPPMVRGAGVGELGDDVMCAPAQMVSGPFATPKNSDRRDMNGSVQLMTPLWRGSAAGTF